MLPAIILFAATYVLMIAFGKYRPYIALASGVIFIISGMLPFNQIIGALDFNVLLMHSIGVNVSGQIASVIAGGLILALVRGMIGG